MSLVFGSKTKVVGKEKNFKIVFYERFVSWLFLLVGSCKVRRYGLGFGFLVVPFHGKMLEQKGTVKVMTDPVFQLPSPALTVLVLVVSVRYQSPPVFGPCTSREKC